MNKYEAYLSRIQKGISEFKPGNVYYSVNIETLWGVLVAAGFVGFSRGTPNWGDYTPGTRAIRITEDGALLHREREWYEEVGFTIYEVIL